MSPSNIRNTVLAGAAIIGLVAASLLHSETDPVRSFMFLVGGLLILKVHLEYFLGMPMGVMYPLAIPSERSKRKAVLFASWGLLLFMAYGAVAW